LALETLVGDVRAQEAELAPVAIALWYHCQCQYLDAISTMFDIAGVSFFYSLVAATPHTHSGSELQITLTTPSQRPKESASTLDVCKIAGSTFLAPTARNIALNSYSLLDLKGFTDRGQSSK
jgi:hypothetical protein